MQNAHWFWIDPEDEIAVASFDALLPALKRGTPPQNLVAELLTYEWLPIEQQDFSVS
jgi:hypothetical protein